MSPVTPPPVARRSGASLLRNLLANGGGYAVSIVLSFLVAPVTIHNLGDARYGVWSLIAEMIGYGSRRLYGNSTVILSCGLRMNNCRLARSSGTSGGRRRRSRLGWLPSTAG